MVGVCRLYHVDDFRILLFAGCESDVYGIRRRQYAYRDFRGDTRRRINQRDCDDLDGNLSGKSGIVNEYRIADFHAIIDELHSGLDFLQIRNYVSSSLSAFFVILYGTKVLFLQGK